MSIFLGEEPVHPLFVELTIEHLLKNQLWARTYHRYFYLNKIFRPVPMNLN